MQVVLAIHSFMRTVGTLKLDLAGFQYLDSRDLIGFIDGTANPKEDKAREAALIPDGQTGEGGSFVLSQQWVHNLPAFNTLSQSEQEQVVGRTKPDSIELEGEAMPPTSHVSRTDYKENGKAMKIVRGVRPTERSESMACTFSPSPVSFAGFRSCWSVCSVRRASGFPTSLSAIPNRSRVHTGLLHHGEPSCRLAACTPRDENGIRLSS